MNIIRNLDKLNGVVDEIALEKLDQSAGVHLKQSNIEFSIISVSDGIVTVEAEQGETSGKYANFRTLIKRANEVFGKYLPSQMQLKVIPTEFIASPTLVVTLDWIDKQMREKEVRIKQIAFDTDLDRKDISGWVTGERSMSRIVKAMFYYYFKSL